MDFQKGQESMDYGLFIKYCAEQIYFPIRVNHLSLRIQQNKMQKLIVLWQFKATTTGQLPWYIYFTMVIP